MLKFKHLTSEDYIMAFAFYTSSKKRNLFGKPYIMSGFKPPLRASHMEPVKSSNNDVLIADEFVYADKTGVSYLDGNEKEKKILVDGLYTLNIEKGVTFLAIEADMNETNKLLMVHFNSKISQDDLEFKHFFEQLKRKNFNADNTHLVICYGKEYKEEFHLKKTQDVSIKGVISACTKQKEGRDEIKKSIQSFEVTQCRQLYATFSGYVSTPDTEIIPCSKLNLNYEKEQFNELIEALGADATLNQLLSSAQGVYDKVTGSKLSSDNKAMLLQEARAFFLEYLAVHKRVQDGKYTYDQKLADKDTLVEIFCQGISQHYPVLSSSLIQKIQKLSNIMALTLPDISRPLYGSLPVNFSQMTLKEKKKQALSIIEQAIDSKRTIDDLNHLLRSLQFNPNFNFLREERHFFRSPASLTYGNTRTWDAIVTSIKKKAKELSKASAEELSQDEKDAKESIETVRSER